MVAIIYNNQNNQVYEIEQPISNLNPLEILDLIQSRRVEEILDNFSIIVESFVDYLPDQFFGMSETMKKISNIQNLSDRDFEKLAIIFEMAVIFCDFGCFYSLENDNYGNSEYFIADKILNFDIAFWNDEQNAYEKMIREFKNIYGDNTIDYIIRNQY